jgi:FixJ family two-component response regulator
MAIKTYAEQLEEVQSAISATLESQEYKTSSRSQRRALLSDLTEREKYLRAMVDRESNGTRTLAGWGE